MPPRGGGFGGAPAGDEAGGAGAFRAVAGQELRHQELRHSRVVGGAENLLDLLQRRDVPPSRLGGNRPRRNSAV